ncbi:hypothetical protein BAE42_29020 [Mesorhizobium loti]|uniref:Uncharacterized protein n=1 Tax=Rhizobium loti TaxID=381 RepID=A0A1A5IGW8_RHILI|nr:hypothetical protein BAE42_29020 [Mesorhizobium loti]OBP80000.1 hypothetical protein BAE39_27155 [Mesorhizobium loti]OBQ59060.1 hypothetical protein A8145_25780 [Mesorhizobium loti]OBQ68038.1 hypothetical protein A8146_11640 [Mesorhizobium loti]
MARAGEREQRVLRLRVPQDRAGLFSTECSSATNVRSAPWWPPSGGVCAGRVDQEGQGDHGWLCGHAFSAINKRLDESLKPFVERPFRELLAYLILDAFCERHLSIAWMLAI